jgi:hypothetical protein
MRLVRNGQYSQVHIPNRPVSADCGSCGAMRVFRLFVHYEFKHIAYLLRWDFEQTAYRVCTECERAHPMSVREMRALFPFYTPLAPRYRRRMVFALVWTPVIAYVVYWNLKHYSS